MLGFGRIGQQVARRALGLGMRVVAYDPFVAKERFRELGVERVESPDEVLAVAEFLTLHLPLTPETRGFLGQEAIAKLPDGARVINAARGELVDEEALVEALRSGKLAAAAVDVYAQEPYEGPLLELDNVVVTPHLAASTEEAQDRAGVIVAEQVVAALEGGLVTNAVNIPSIGAEDLEVLGPFVPLAAKLGRLAMELAEGRAERITLSYYGTLSGLRHAPADRRRAERRLPGPHRAAGQLRQRAGRRRRARDRGRRGAPARLPRLHQPRPRRGRRRCRVAGTIIGNENRHWLVNALGFELEMELAPLMVFFRYDDVPGVIGLVGTVFGEAGVNIANMAVSRSRRGGKALMALSLDGEPPAELVEAVREQGFDDARLIRLGERED